MQKYFTLKLLLLTAVVSAQPRNYSTAEILLMLKKLNTLGRVLYVAAHPDDENTRMITYFAQKENMDVAYISLTRGDGGQNLIGTEQGALLGLIRTQELLAARSIDGGEQFFSSANDFGYSKTHTETLEKWDEQEVLRDMVFVIRKFRPDVIITRFPPLKYNYDTHGHHSASAYLAERAFDMAADPKTFPEQLQTVETWQAKRLYWNTSTWFYRSTKMQLDTTDKIKIDVGAYIQELGESVTEIAARSRSMHKSQGFGAPEQRGREIEYLEFVKGVPSEKDIFEGIDVSWKRIKDSDRTSVLLKKALDEFDPRERTAILPLLLESYQLLNGRNDFWSKDKLEEVRTLIYAVCGLFLESTASDFYSTDSVKLTTVAINRSGARVNWAGLSFSSGKSAKLNRSLLFNKPETVPDSLLLSPAEISIPYWLVGMQNLQGMYPLPDEKMRARPENFPTLDACFDVEVNDVSIQYCNPVVYKWTDRVKGEIYRPFIVSPDRTVHPDRSVMIFSDEKPQHVTVTVKAWKPAVTGLVSFINLPDGWKCDPAEVTVTLAGRGDEQEVRFLITPSEGNAQFQLKPAFKPITNARYDINFYSRDYIEIAHDHIPYQGLFPLAAIKVIKMDLMKHGPNIAYIQGAGDEVDEGLHQAGYNVTNLSKENLSTTDLGRFDAIMIGIRAYNTESWLPPLKSKLMEYVRNGGNVIVQYQTTAGLLTSDFGPYQFKIGRGRVTVEEAEVTLLAPEHPIFNYPNKIEKKDFEGWVQERGLYFASEWDEKYQPLLVCSDPGEEGLKGSLLIADYGKGAFMYTGISFFRQIPAGVPGAYRLLANMISYKSEESKQH